MGANLLAAESEAVGYYLAGGEEVSGLPIKRLCLHGRSSS